MSVLVGSDSEGSFERYALMVSPFLKLMKLVFAVTVDRPATGWSMDDGGPANCVFAMASRFLSDGLLK